MKRYESANLPQTQIASPSGARTATTIAAQSLDSLSSKLDQFSSMAIKQHAVKRMGDAQEQAAIDDATGKPFHKESVYTEYGKAYNNTRSATYAANAEIDLTNTSAQLAEEHKSNPKGYHNAMKAYREKLALDAPTPELGSVIAISGRKIQNHQFGKLSIAKAEDLRNYERATYDKTIELKISQKINSLSIGDTKTADLITESMLDYTDTQVLAGNMTQAEALNVGEKAKFRVNKGVLEAQVRDLIEAKRFDEARKIVSDFGDEIPEGYSVSQFDAVNSSITRIYNGGVKANHAVTKKTTADADKLAKKQIALKRKGVSSDEAIITDETKANLSPDVKKAVIIQEETDAFMLQFADLTQLEKEKAFTEARNKPQFTEMDIEVQKAIEANIKETSKGYKDDPITQGEIEGSYPPTETIYPGMENFAEVISDREFFMEINVENSGQDAKKLFKKAEVQSFIDILQGDDETAKMQLMNMVSTLPKEQAELIYNQFDKKGADTYVTAGRLITKGQNQVARTLMFGSKADVKLEANVKTTNYTNLVSILQGHDVDTLNSMTQMVTDYNKGTMGMTGSTASSKEAMEAVYGKVMKFNGRQTFAPVGVSEDLFKSWLSGYTVEGQPGLTEDIQSLAGFWDENLQLVWEQDGNYSLKDASTGMVITDDKGDPIILDYYRNK